jgi:PP-loop superfamily ATP-utilizing enzyme
MRPKVRKIDKDKLPKLTEAEKIELTVAPIRVRRYEDIALSDLSIDERKSLAASMDQPVRSNPPYPAR